MKARWILLVEDNSDDVELTRLALEENRIANLLVVARDGAEALEIIMAKVATDPPDPPAVIFLDLKLPKVDGIDVLRAIRVNPKTRLLPVVILTSSEEERDLAETYRLGANSYIRKPVDFAAFVEAMRHMGFYWLLLNRLPPTA